MKKYLIIFILYVVSNCSYGQSFEERPIFKTSFSDFLKPKKSKDAIFYGVLDFDNDSLVEIKRIYIHAHKNIYFSFVNDSIFEIGKFRKYYFIQCYKSSFILMEKKRYWKLYNTKEKSVEIIDNYAKYKKRHIRLFPCFRIVLDKKK